MIKLTFSMAKRFSFILLLIFLLITGCTYQNDKLHKDLSDDSPQIVSFSYKVYEKPPIGEHYYLPFKIFLENNYYYGSDAYLKFEDGTNYNITGNKIKFTFDKDVINLGVHMRVYNASEPLYVKFKGFVNDSDNPKHFHGRFKINRKQTSINHNY